MARNEVGDLGATKDEVIDELRSQLMALGEDLDAAKTKIDELEEIRDQLIDEAKEAEHKIEALEKSEQDLTDENEGIKKAISTFVDLQVEKLHKFDRENGS